MRYLKRENGCVCCKRALKSREPVGVIDDNFLRREGGQNDSFLDEALAMMTGRTINMTTTTKSLEPTTAKQVAAYAKDGAEKMAEMQWESLYDRKKKTSLIAPFKLDEIKLGSLLGVGGSSYVFEIKSFDTDSTSKSTSVVDSSSSTSSPKKRSSSSSFSTSSGFMSLGSSCRWYDREQEKARQFLVQHVIKSQDDFHQDKGLSPATDDMPNGQTRYALKHLRPNLIQTPERFARAARDLSREAELMLSVSHPNIIKLRGWSVGGPEAYEEGRHNSYFLVIDRMVETLESRIGVWRRQWKNERSMGPISILQKCLSGRKNNNLTEDNETSSTTKDPTLSLLVERIKVAHDMSSALEYLHEKRIMHRDIKSSNAGFDVRGDIKIYDFGLARSLPESVTGDCQEAFHMSSVGTRRYAAPEVLAKEPYNLKADVFGLGVTMWEMLILSTPTRVDQPRHAFPAPKRKPMLSCPCWPQPLQRLVSSMLADEPTNRPTMTHTRSTLMMVLDGLSCDDKDLQAELMADKDMSPRRRRSTFLLECYDVLGTDKTEGFDEDPTNFQSSRTSISSFQDRTFEYVR